MVVYVFKTLLIFIVYNFSETLVFVEITVSQQYKVSNQKVFFLKKTKSCNCKENCISIP